MDLKNFDGTAVNLIDTYIYESPTLNDRINENFFSLISAIIRGSEIFTLLDIFSDLDLREEHLANKLKDLNRNLGNRKVELQDSYLNNKLNNLEVNNLSLETQAYIYDLELSSASVANLKSEIDEIKKKQEKYYSMKDATSAIKKFTEESLVERIDSLTGIERLELIQNFKEIIENTNSKIDTLSKEITSRQGRIATDTSLKEEAEICHVTPSEYLVRVNNEIKERIQNRDLLEHYNQVVNSFYPTKKDQLVTRTILK